MPDLLRGAARWWPDMGKAAQRLALQLHAKGQTERALQALALVAQRADREFLLTQVRGERGAS